MTRTILLIDDDRADQELVRRALSKVDASTDFQTVNDGQEALDYLLARNGFAGRADKPAPALILLDINMPRLDGRKFLRQMRANEALRGIPVVTYTTSTANRDIQDMYQLGTNSYIAKPASFSTLVDLMKSLHSFWFETARLPA